MRRLATLVATLLCAAVLTCISAAAQSVTISPGYVNLPLGGTQQYTATVSGLSPQTVTWSASGGGSISPSGLYTAPSTVPAGSVLVIAKATANPQVLAAVYVNPEGPDLR